MDKPVQWFLFFNILHHKIRHKEVLVKLSLISLFFWSLFISNINAYAVDANFLDKISAAEVDNISATDLAELPAEAQLIMAESAEFASGESIIVYNEDRGVWEEKIIQQAGVAAALKNVCVLGAVALPPAVIAAFVRLPTLGAVGLDYHIHNLSRHGIPAMVKLPTPTSGASVLMIVTGVASSMAAWLLHSCLNADL